jgi:hypothetical protein
MTHQITTAELEAIFSTKIGLHRFMTVDMDGYLPDAKYNNVEWLGHLFYNQRM